MILLLSPNRCMNFDFKLFDSIRSEAEKSPRRRMHYDLRTSSDDTSQRMLNVLMKDTVIPVHRHNDTSETVIVCRGKFYDAEGNKVSEVVLAAGRCPESILTRTYSRTNTKSSLAGSPANEVTDKLIYLQN